MSDALRSTYKSVLISRDSSSIKKKTENDSSPRSYQMKSGNGIRAELISSLYCGIYCRDRKADSPCCPGTTVENFFRVFQPPKETIK